MKFKKAIVSGLSLGAIIAPTIASVACGSSSSQTSVVLALDGYDHTENDKSFNEAAFKGIQTFLGKNPTVVKPASGTVDTTFLQMYANVKSGTTIVAPGYIHASPLSKATTEISGKNIILLDEKVAKDNIASVTFKVEQAAYMAGYSISKYIHDNWTAFSANVTVPTGEKVKISTFGGMDFPTVTGFMGGFKKGIKEHLSTITTDADKKVEWYEFATKAEHFSGGFAKGEGKSTATKLIDAGVDIILPVAGPQTEDVLQVLNEKSAKGYVIGVDSAQEDLYAVNDSYKNKVAFSILKELNLATQNLLKVIINKETVAGFEGLGKETIGTLDNGLIGISSTDNSAIKSVKEIYAAALNNQALKDKALAVNSEFALG